MLIKFKAKVMLTSEDQMEAESKYDLGDISRSKEWVWRMIAIPVEEIYKIIEYNKAKTIIQTYDDEKILVAEAFEEVSERWEELKIIGGDARSKRTSSDDENEDENDD